MAALNSLAPGVGRICWQTAVVKINQATHGDKKYQISLILPSLPVLYGTISFFSGSKIRYVVSK
jgi:hypothetical protein